MPAFIKVLILAVIQGLTEFLPVSSSGHLVLGKHLLGLDAPGIFLEVALHLGTLIAVIIYYRKRIIGLFRGVFTGDPGARLYAGAVIAGTLPAALAYALASDHIEALFGSPVTASAMLCVTGGFLLLLTLPGTPSSDLTIRRGILIGLAQACAMVPGISRSGSTIVLARRLGFSPERAAEFSLLLSIPALAGAALIKAIGLRSAALGDLSVAYLLAGAIVSGIVGYVAIICVVRALKAHKFWMFGFYCIAAGITGILRFTL